MRTLSKDARIDLRLPGAIKDRVKRVAMAENKQLSEYIIDALTRDTAHKLAEQQFVVMDDAEFTDFTAFVNAEPSEHAKAGLARLAKYDPSPAQLND